MQQTTMLAAICAKAHAGQALYFNELRFLAQTSERAEVQQMARRIRQQYAPASVLTYAERAGQPQLAPRSHAHACTSLAAALELIAWLRLNLPERAHDCFGVADVITLHEQTQLPTETILRHLSAAGQHRLHGDDEHLLRLALSNSDAYTDQQHPMAALWLRVLREAQQIGMLASAAVLLGADVAEATYLHWLQRIRIIQDYSQRTVGSGFLSVVYVVPMAQTSLSDTDLHRIALTRLYLNGIPHHQLRGYVAQSVPPAHVILAARAGIDDLGELGNRRAPLQAALQCYGYRLQQRDMYFQPVVATPEAAASRTVAVQMPSALYRTAPVQPVYQPVPDMLN